MTCEFATRCISLLNCFIFLCLLRFPPPHLLSCNVKLLSTPALSHTERDPSSPVSSRTKRFLPVSRSASRLLWVGMLPPRRAPKRPVALASLRHLPPPSLTCVPRSAAGSPCPLLPRRPPPPLPLSRGTPQPSRHY